MSDLQLQDYADGYRFRLKCRSCGYGWYEEPRALLVRPETHARMYLGELERLVMCQACRRSGVVITPLILMATHHFIGGLA